ncbi:MAG: outer membrane beta-barrel protein [Acidobacteriota bacterium]
MKTSTRLSSQVIGFAALALACAHAQAYDVGNSGTTPSTPADSSTTMGTSTTTPSSSTGTTSGASTGMGSNSSYGSMQNLPTEPTAAGYSTTTSRDSWLPYTTSGYVGLSLGNGRLDTACVAGQDCSDPGGALHVYTGGMFTPYVGMQLGYFRLGAADRNGGETKVSGVNLVLTGVAPLGSMFSLTGRVGGTYGWTDTSVGTGVVAPSGKENGFGASYGAGLSWDFDRNWSATLDWDRHHLKYAGDEKRNTDVATIGFKYRF